MRILSTLCLVFTIAVSWIVLAETDDVFEKYQVAKSRAKRDHLMPVWSYWIWELYTARNCDDAKAKLEASWFKPKYSRYCPWLKVYCPSIKGSLSQTSDKWCKYRHAAKVIYPLCCEDADHGTPVDGGWSNWRPVQPVTSCSATCGQGSQVFEFKRSCTNPAPSNGGRPCTGPSANTVTRSCTTPTTCTSTAPTDGRWSAWGTPEPISECSVTCGRGLKKVKYSRKCNNPAPSNGGKSCSGRPYVTVLQYCYTGKTCTTSQVNGGWSEWKNAVAVSECSVTCGIGNQNFRVTRTCDNPPPSNGGKPCAGSSSATVTRECNTNAVCQVAVDGGWSDWKNPVPVSDCSVTCGSGTRNFRLSRTCDNPPPSNGGKPCTGSSTATATRTCNTNIACTVAVDGGWSDWKNPVPVTDCSVTCGSGTRNFRLSRTCDSPPPSNGGKRCAGRSTVTVTRTCNTNIACTVAVDGGWSDWKNPVPVSDCSVTCGSGTRDFRLSRTCDNPPPSNGGKPCAGRTTSTVTRTCNTNVGCPVATDGGWSNWKNPVPVSDCSVTCGSGTRNFRLSRTCNNPPPSNGGKPCAGSSTSTVTRTCNTNVACRVAVDGGWSDWKNPVPVSDCSVTCGSGTRNFRLSRTCNNPSPSNGGKPCTGSSTSVVTRTCHTNVVCPAGSCGRSVLGTVPTSKIVGGVPALEKEFPWQAAVLLNGFLQCGGVLIDEMHVLTAGHCLENGGRVSVQLGKYYVDDARNSNMQVIQAASYKLHEKFRQPTGLLNDIAIITLETPAIRNDYVIPICIPDASMVLNYNRFGIASGFGLDASSQNGGKQPSELNKVSLQMYDSEPCRTIFSETTRVVGPGVICASNGLNGGKDSCQGDSGGPLMADINGAYYLYGLVSTGRGCAQPGETGFYTKIHYYSDWIKANS